MGEQYNFNVVRLGIPGLLISRWPQVAGLKPGPNGWRRRGFARLVPFRPDERFDRFVRQQVAAFVERGELPAADVAPGILNLADDVLAGREPTIRAGDYIAIQNHLRQAR